MKNKIYEILRKHVAKMATGKLGKVEILDDEIVCYVDGKKLKKKEKYLHRYNLIFKMVNPIKEIYKIYNLQKPVHYIVKDINFDMEVNIMASMRKCHVTFENCTFTTLVRIDFADHLTFKNNKYKACTYKDYRSIIPEGHFYISTGESQNNKIEFINDTIEVPDLKYIPVIKAPDNIKTNYIKKANIKIWLYAKNITMTNVNLINVESMDLRADNLIMNDTNIDSKELSIYVKDITANNSTIKTDIADINSETDNAISQIQNININYNHLYVDGIEVNKNEKNIDNQSLKLQKQRLELINSLKKIERTCEKEISEEIKRQPLTKVLKK